MDVAVGGDDDAFGADAACCHEAPQGGAALEREVVAFLVVASGHVDGEFGDAVIGAFEEGGQLFELERGEGFELCRALFEVDDVEGDGLLGGDENGEGVAAQLGFVGRGGVDDDSGHEVESGVAEEGVFAVFLYVEVSVAAGAVAAAMAPRVMATGRGSTSAPTIKCSIIRAISTRIVAITA